MDWARSLALAHPKLADFLLHPSSSIWPWLWHQVWRLKARRRSYKDAVTSRWAAKAVTSANASWWRGPEHLLQNATCDIERIGGKILKRRRIIAEQEAKMRILEGELLEAKRRFKRRKAECREHEFYKLLGQTMLPPKEDDKKRDKISKKKKKLYYWDKEKQAWVLRDTLSVGVVSSKGESRSSGSI